MKIGRIPVYLFAIGAFFKTLLVVLWRLYQPSDIYDYLIKYDPIGIFAAENVTSIFFDPRRFAPKSSEIVFYEVVLIIAFAIECFVLGLIIQMAIQKVFKRGDSGVRGHPRT
jgi:hypothetical protein